MARKAVTSLTLGHATEAGAAFELPLDLVTQTLFIGGRRGSGKTNTAVVMVEELLGAGQQVVIIDPVGVWWGLKSSRDGKGDGFPIVLFGGTRGDMPLGEHDGKLLADFVVEHRLSCVLSLDGLPSKAAERRFVTAFAEQLYLRKREASHRSPVMLVLEEAGLVVPQRVSADEAQMVRSVQRLVRQGRAFGIGVTMIDQRPATVNKDVLTQIELLVAHQVTSPQDRKALEAWVEAHDAGDRRKLFNESIAALSTGTAWFWSPAWLDVFECVSVRHRNTFDSSATPKAGQQITAPTKMAAVNLDELRSQLKDSVAQAEANDPAQLKKQIADLQKQLKGKQVGTSAADVKALVASAVQQESASWEQRVHAFNALVSVLMGEVRSIGDRFATAMNVLAKSNGHHKPTINRGLSPSKAVKIPAVVKAPTIKGSEPRQSDVKLNPKQQAILAALKRRGEMGHSTTDDKTIAALIGMARSGTFSAYMSRLNTADLIEGPASARRLTHLGQVEVAGIDPLPTGKKLLEYWKQQHLNPKQAHILDALVLVHPAGIAKAELAEQIGQSPKSGTYDAYLSRMRRLGLIEGSSELRCTDALMQGVTA